MMTCEGLGPSPPPCQFSEPPFELSAISFWDSSDPTFAG